MRFWTEDRVTKLRTLAAQGISASNIARELGADSRLAVIGKCFRDGIALRSFKNAMRDRFRKNLGGGTNA